MRGAGLGALSRGRRPGAEGKPVGGSAIGQGDALGGDALEGGYRPRRRGGVAIDRGGGVCVARAWSAVARAVWKKKSRGLADFSVVGGLRGALRPSLGLPRGSP